MTKITGDEWNQFKSIPAKTKVDCMEAYLIGLAGRRLNMQEVAAIVYGNENYSYTVSLIHRCYNFSGQNGGKYRGGCPFEQAHRYRVTRADIEAFVKAYPNGTFREDITFEDFLVFRINHSGNRSPAKTVPSVPRQSSQSRRVYESLPDSSDAFEENFSVVAPVSSRTTGNIQQEESSDPPLTTKFKLIMLCMGLAGVLLLFILLFTGNLFKQWGWSLFGLFLAIGGFSWLILD